MRAFCTNLAISSNSLIDITAFLFLLVFIYSYFFTSTEVSASSNYWGLSILSGTLEIFYPGSPGSSLDLLGFIATPLPLVFITSALTSYRAGIRAAPLPKAFTGISFYPLIFPGIDCPLPNDFPGISWLVEIGGYCTRPLPLPLATGTLTFSSSMLNSTAVVDSSLYYISLGDLLLLLLSFSILG